MSNNILLHREVEVESYTLLISVLQNLSQTTITPCKDRKLFVESCFQNADDKCTKQSND